MTQTEITGTLDRTALEVIQELKDNGYPINVIYDIGANDSRWYKLWKPRLKDATFFLFEGNPDNVCKAKLQDDEHYYNVLLSYQNDLEVTFYTPDDYKVENTGASYYRENTPHYKEGKNSRILITKTLDSFAKDLPLPDFIKLDTQGSEVDIIKGATKALKHAKAVLCEMPIMPYNSGAPKFSEYIDTFYDHGFIPSGVDHLAIRKGVFNQTDIIFVKKEIVQEIHDYKQKYSGF